MTNETALREALEEAKRQLEYLDSRWPTGTTPAVLARIDNLLQSPSQPVVAEADVDRIVRTLYEARPFTVISQALSDATGLPMGDPIPWDAFIASGGDPSGLRWYVEQTIAALAAHPQASPPPVQSEHIAEVLLASACSTGPFAHESATIIRGTEWVRKSKAIQAIRAIRAAIGSAGSLDTQEGDSVAFLATTDWSDEAKRSWEAQTGQPADQMPLPDMSEALCKIADAVVPEYRTTAQSYSCSGHHAKRWGAAYQGAFMAITGESS